MAGLLDTLYIEIGVILKADDIRTYISADNAGAVAVSI